MNQTTLNFDGYYDKYHSSKLYGGFNTPADVCLNRTLDKECDTINVGGLEIFAPELLPCCLGALILGLTLAKKVYERKDRNYLMYTITFAMTGVMMTDAGWNDCILVNLWPKNTFAHIFWAVIDVGLTSSIGLAFLFDALLDAKIIKNKASTYYSYFIGMGLIFTAWTYCMVHKMMIGFLILYMGIVGIGCGSWVIIQMILTIWTQDWKSFKYLVYAGVSGGFGFFSIMDTKLYLYLCEHFSCHFNTQFIWFLVTDIAIYYIYLYYITRASFLKSQEQQKEVIPSQAASMEMVNSNRQDRIPLVQADHNSM